MRAVTVRPSAGTSLEVCEVPDPVPGAGELLVDGISVGVCGTDKEIVAGGLGRAPRGEERLIIGHESLGRVRQAPTGSGFAAGDLVVGVVRRPDPEPCGACARGEFDMCRNGRYTERGIRERHGYASRFWTVESDYAVRLDPSLERVGVLLEPATVLAKAWEQVERIGARSWFEPERVLVTGAGPIGLLAALLARQRGLDVHVLDRVTSGRKPALVAALGATYHSGSIGEVASALRPDVVIEATGVGDVVLGAMRGTANYGIVCLIGVSPEAHRVPVEPGALNNAMVRGNVAVVGSVNANRRHYRAGAEALLGADPAWLERMITRRVPLRDAAEAFTAQDGDIKVVIDLD